MVVNSAHCFLHHKVVQKTVFCNDMVTILNDLLNAKIKSCQIALYSKLPNFKPAKNKAFTVVGLTKSVIEYRRCGFEERLPVHSPYLSNLYNREIVLSSSLGMS